MDPIIKIIHDTAFYGSISYTLEETESGGYKIILDRSKYRYKTSIEKFEYSVDSGIVKKALEELMSSPVYICPESICGLDGETTIIEIERGFNRVKFEWWDGIPPQWANLRKVLKLVEDCCN